VDEREVNRLVEVLNIAPNDKDARDALLRHIERAIRFDDAGLLSRIQPNPHISQGVVRAFPEPDKLRFEYQRPDNTFSDLTPSLLREKLWATSDALYLTHPVRLRMAWSTRRGLHWAVDCLEQAIPVLERSEQILVRQLQNDIGVVPHFRDTLERIRQTANHRRRFDVRSLTELQETLSEFLQERDHGDATNHPLYVRDLDPYWRARASSTGPGREGGLGASGRSFSLLRALQRTLQRRVGDAMTNIFEAMPKGVTDHERKFQTDRLLAYLGHQRPPPEVNHAPDQ